MTILPREESIRYLKMPAKSLRCMSYEDTLREMEAFLDGKIDNPQSTIDAYVDITEPMSASAARLLDFEDPDATENSSSFGDTLSGSDNVSGTSDAEVESEFRVDSGLAPTLDSYSSAFFMSRKKKVMTHWRSYIHPLMSKCKWAEIKIKELESQALKYSRELEANEQTKMLELHQYTSDFCSKSSPCFNHSGKKKHLKRRKRKRVENVTDISSYMSHHPLFSYFENKRSDDGALVADGEVKIDSDPRKDEFAVDDDWFKVGDDSLEQILLQIETVQSHIQRLRSHLETVMLKNGVNFSSYENLSLLAPYDAQTSAAQSPAFSAGNGDNMSFGAIYIPQHMDFEIDDLDLPDSIISGYNEVAQIPDIIESIVGLLSAANVTTHQTQMLESGENLLDDTNNQNRGLRERQMSCGALDQLNVEYHNLENKGQNISSRRGMRERQISCGALDQLNGEYHILDNKEQKVSTYRAMRERQIFRGAHDQLNGEYQNLENKEQNISSHRTMQERQMSSGVLDQLNGEYHHDLEIKEQNISSLRVSNGSAPDSVTGYAMGEEGIILKSCLASEVRIPKNKRKRGERKAGTGGWNMKSTGELGSTDTPPTCRTPCPIPTRHDTHWTHVPTTLI